MKKTKNYVLFWVSVYIALGVLGGLFLAPLELFGVIKIRNKHLVPKRPKGLMLISNHLSFWEPFVLPYLFIKRAFLNPIKYFPYSAPDLNNFDKWWWSLFKERFIFFPRGNNRGCEEAIIAAMELLELGRIFIIFPEGGRTGTNKTNKWEFSKSGKYKLRPLASGAIHLALRTHCDILPVWVEGSNKVMPIGSKLPKFWKPIVITIGSVFKLEGEDNKDGVLLGKAIFTEKILELADQDLN